MIEDNGMQVDKEMHDDFVTIIDKKQKENGNPFLSVFWQKLFLLKAQSK